ncbi:hypothetical protein ACFE04_030483 [Oxalis oulophora]
MDESWRMRMGMEYATSTKQPSFRRWSMEEDNYRGPTIPARHSNVSSTMLDVDDFCDVFGGPPRRMLAKKLFSGEFNFYEEIFKLPEFGSPATSKGGRSLTAFRIPARDVGFEFNADVIRTSSPAPASEASSMVDGGSYGGGYGWRSRNRSPGTSKSKSNSSSALSSEELSPLRPVAGDDVSISSFASKLRPLNVPSRWDSPAKMPEKRVQMPSPPCNRPSFMDYQSAESDYADSTFNKTSCYGYTQHVSSPETITPQPESYHHSNKKSVDNLELNCPSTPASSLCQEPLETKVGLDEHNRYQEDDMESESDDEIMSSYVIEITSNHCREGSAEELSIDEAIAWAKEKYQTSTSPRQPEKEQAERPNVYEFFDRQSWMTEEEKEQEEAKMELEMLDEDIRLWSSNKENNIRSLLSTLHHVLWPNSGWYPVPLTDLIESSQVKKAYQKARLCLHPDKLQQRGATAPQKYVSEKAFTILQEAWARFINQDVF